MSTRALEQLCAERAWIDLLIHREILRLRASYQLSLDELRGLYVSDEQVDALVATPRSDGSSLQVERLTRAAHEARIHARASRSEDLPWARLGRAFALSELEQDILLLVLAPELDPKYEILFAYLNNDVTRKAPSVQLLARLLRSEGRDRELEVRAALMPRAPLMATHLLHYLPGSEPHALLSTSLKPQRALCSYLLGLGFSDDAVPAELLPATCSPKHAALLPPGFLRELQDQALARSGEAAPAWIVVGRDGLAREAAAGALARTFGLGWLKLDATLLGPAAGEASAALRTASVWQRLEGALLHVGGLAALQEREERVLGEALATLKPAPHPVALECEDPSFLLSAGAHLQPSVIMVPEMDHDSRRRFWREALSARRMAADASALAVVGERFALGGRQIEAAVCSLERGATPGRPLGLDALLAAARHHSDRAIASLAQRVEARYTWSDLVVPPTIHQRLQDIVQAIRHRSVVYRDWGFGRRAGSPGLHALFSGVSGTGKTMAASVIAAELGLDLYRIDLSQTVSKYIGETEKNLDRAFRAASQSNAILFFDEADALLGKRSEVKDAHDRYSNLEVAYLLQKLEDYAGVILFASNLARNMDSAFSRRMHFVVEFPLPDQPARERLWRSMFPPSAPLEHDVDFEFLAQQFPLAGGDIRNVALDAAFLAAQNGQRIAMKEVVQALGRQWIKQGRIPSVVEFKQHHGLLEERATAGVRRG